MYSTIGQKDAELQTIYERLAEIKSYLDREIAYKQAVIDRLEQTIDRLEQKIRDQQSLMVQKEQRVAQIEEQLQACRNAAEGSRQLINKLLNDISNYQKEINWYKSTFERRSIFGVLKEKLFKRPR